MRNLAGMHATGEGCDKSESAAKYMLKVNSDYIYSTFGSVTCLCLRLELFEILRGGVRERRQVYSQCEF